ncbi:hypothetical protein PI126_g15093 [Phytophthora idaei]|nr:hypothetical protein PI126_g15093 [Phytophthora idaei]
MVRRDPLENVLRKLAEHVGMTAPREREVRCRLETEVQIACGIWARVACAITLGSALRLTPWGRELPTRRHRG